LKALSDEKEAIFREVARGKIKPLEGAVELVMGLKKAGFELAIGSSTPKKNIEVVLESIGLAEVFHVRVGAEDVSRGKPDPEVFLKAAELIGVRPERCVVIEDAVAGIKAAKNAGMKAIAVTTTHPRERLAEADIIVERIADVTVDMIEELLNQR